MLKSKESVLFIFTFLNLNVAFSSMDVRYGRTIIKELDSSVPSLRHEKASLATEYSMEECRGMKKHWPSQTHLCDRHPSPNSSGISSTHGQPTKLTYRETKSCFERVSKISPTPDPSSTGSERTRICQDATERSGEKRGEDYAKYHDEVSEGLTSKKTGSFHTMSGSETHPNLDLIQTCGSKFESGSDCVGDIEVERFCTTDEQTRPGELLGTKPLHYRMNDKTLINNNFQVSPKENGYSLLAASGDVILANSNTHGIGRDLGEKIFSKDVFMGNPNPEFLLSGPEEEWLEGSSSTYSSQDTEANSYLCKDEHFPIPKKKGKNEDRGSISQDHLDHIPRYFQKVTETVQSSPPPNDPIGIISTSSHLEDVGEMKHQSAQQEPTSMGYEKGKKMGVSPRKGNEDNIYFGSAEWQALESLVLLSSGQMTRRGSNELHSGGSSVSSQSLVWYNIKKQPPRAGRKRKFCSSNTNSNEVFLGSPEAVSKTSLLSEKNTCWQKGEVRVNEPTGLKPKIKFGYKSQAPSCEEVLVIHQSGSRNPIIDYRAKRMRAATLQKFDFVTENSNYKSSMEIIHDSERFLLTILGEVLYQDWWGLQRIPRNRDERVLRRCVTIEDIWSHRDEILSKISEENHFTLHSDSKRSDITLTYQNFLDKIRKKEENPVLTSCEEHILYLAVKGGSEQAYMLSLIRLYNHWLGTTKDDPFPAEKWALLEQFNSRRDRSSE